MGSTYHSKSHDPKSHLGYTRFEILFILSSLVNTAVLISFAGDSARLLRWSAAVWATLFTLIVIKFHFEKDMIAKGKFDWPIIHYDLPYYGIQTLHAVIAALVWYGVLKRVDVEVTVQYGKSRLRCATLSHYTAARHCHLSGRRAPHGSG